MLSGGYARGECLEPWYAVTRVIVFSKVEGELCALWQLLRVAGSVSFELRSGKLRLFSGCGADRMRGRIGGNQRYAGKVHNGNGQVW